MAEYSECRKCGANLDDEVFDVVLFAPYCPACWPARCPHCNVKEFMWSTARDGPKCDSGCYANGAELNL